MSKRATAFAPGRINLIGEHTDYNQGLAVAFALTAGVTVRARPHGAPWIDAVALDLGACRRCALDAEPSSRRPRESYESDESEEPEESEESGGWVAFLQGAIGELQRRGIPLRGAELEISGTVPQGAGLASSAALAVALCLALVEIAGVPVPDRIELARICARIENDWVGARTGLLDQLASLFGRSHEAVLIDFRAVSVLPVALDTREHRLVTVDSGDARANAASGYNVRRAECERACAVLGVRSLRDATPEMAERLPDPLARRVRHVLSENARVAETVDALARGDLEAIGRLLNASHASLRDDYEVSTPAVERTVARLLDAGASGARIMGGGFGGHVLALLGPGVPTPPDALEVTPAGPGARIVDS